MRVLLCAMLLGAAALQVGIAQTYTTVSTVFASGGSIQSVGTNTLATTIGQSVSGGTTVGAFNNGAGFIFQYGGQTGIPPNTGIFTVTTANDTGEGSFRSALQIANQTSGLNIIQFNIPGSGVHTITPATPLPMITDATIIDGYSQPGSSPNTNGPGQPNNAVLLIEINGVNGPAGGQTGSIIARSHNVTIRGLVINRSPSAAIHATYFSTPSTGIVIEGNYIGTDPAGIQALPNSVGVDVEYCRGVRIGGTSLASQNVISGNTTYGIAIGTWSAGGADHVIQGNLIGTSASGTTALGNGLSGIRLAYQTSNVLVGGSNPHARNVISGNLQWGITCDGGAPVYPTQTIKGNYIGTDVTGTMALGNGYDGIRTTQYATTIGGSEPGAGNIISGNNENGIQIAGGDSTRIMGNLIGTDTSGTIAIRNARAGILIDARDVLVGGVTIGARNVIACNGDSPVWSAGVLVLGYHRVRNAILGNSIYDNAGLGIDLSLAGANGVTPNDACDADSLVPNEYQNYPVLTTALSNGDSVLVEGELESKSGGLYRVEFFSSPTRDSTGHGEGKTYLGAITVAIDTACMTTFIAMMPFPVQSESYVSATATDAAGNTSEFSPNVLLGTTTVLSTGNPLPRTFFLHQNHPNPFNPSTNLTYELPEAGRVTLKVYNMLGQEIATLVDGVQGAGIRSVKWDAESATSGVYFCRMVAISGTRTYSSVRKMVVVK